MRKGFKNTQTHKKRNHKQGINLIESNDKKRRKAGKITLIEQLTAW